MEVKEWSGRYLSGDDPRGSATQNEEEAGCMKFEEILGKGTTLANALGWDKGWFVQGSRN